MRCRHTLVLIACLMPVSAALAQAPETRPLASGRPGTGFTVGLALGISRTSLSGVGTKPPVQSVDLGLGWHMGYQATSRWAMLLMGSASVYPYSGTGRDRKRSFESLVPALEYRVDDRLRLSAGVGLQLDAPVFYDVRPGGADEKRFSRGVGVVVGMSYALRSGRAFSPDLRARFATGNAHVPGGRETGRSASLLLGVRRDPRAR